jgi:hypothetical protein
MRAWTRLLAAFAAVVAGAVLLKLAPPLVVLVAFVGGFWYAAHRLRTRDRATRASGAELLGLRRETEDPFGLLGYPLEILARVDDPAIDELVWGRWRGSDVRVFGLSFRAPAGSPALAPAANDRRRFAVALTVLDEDIPAVVVEPAVFMTRLARPPRLARVVTGDPRFDDAWSIWGRDAASALAVANADVRSWLSSLGEAWGVELSGRIAVVYGPTPDRPDVVAVLEIMRELVGRVPGGRAARPPTV